MTETTDPMCPPIQRRLGISAGPWDALPWFRPGPIVTDVLEGGPVSLFTVDEDGVHTSPLDERLLQGTTRQQVIAVLARAGIPVHERTLGPGDLEHATEVFTASARYGILGAENRAPLRHRTSRGGPFTSWLAQELKAGPAPRQVRRPRVDPHHARPRDRVRLPHSVSGAAPLRGAWCNA